MFRDIGRWMAIGLAVLMPFCASAEEACVPPDLEEQCLEEDWETSEEMKLAVEEAYMQSAEEKASQADEENMESEPEVTVGSVQAPDEVAQDQPDEEEDTPQAVKEVIHAMQSPEESREVRTEDTLPVQDMDIDRAEAEMPGIPDDAAVMEMNQVQEEMSGETEDAHDTIEEDMEETLPESSLPGGTGAFHVMVDGKRIDGQLEELLPLGIHVYVHEEGSWMVCCSGEDTERIQLDRDVFPRGQLEICQVQGDCWLIHVSADAQSMTEDTSAVTEEGSDLHEEQWEEQAPRPEAEDVAADLEDTMETDAAPEVAMQTAPEEFQGETDVPGGTKEEQPTYQDPEDVPAGRMEEDIWEEMLDEESTEITIEGLMATATDLAPACDEMENGAYDLVPLKEAVENDMETEEAAGASEVSGEEAGVTEANSDVPEETDGEPDETAEPTEAETEGNQAGKSGKAKPSGKKSGGRAGGDAGMVKAPADEDSADDSADDSEVTDDESAVSGDASEETSDAVEEENGEKKTAKSGKAKASKKNGKTTGGSAGAKKNAKASAGKSSTGKSTGEETVQEKQTGTTILAGEGLSVLTWEGETLDLSIRGPAEDAVLPFTASRISSLNENEAEDTLLLYVDTEEIEETDGDVSLMLSEACSRVLRSAGIEYLVVTSGGHVTVMQLGQMVQGEEISEILAAEDRWQDVCYRLPVAGEDDLEDAVHVLVSMDGTDYCLPEENTPGLYMGRICRTTEDRIPEIRSMWDEAE